MTKVECGNSSCIRNINGICGEEEIYVSSDIDRNDGFLFCQSYKRRKPIPKKVKK